MNVHEAAFVFCILYRIKPEELYILVWINFRHQSDVNRPQNLTSKVRPCAERVMQHLIKDRFSLD